MRGLNRGAVGVTPALNNYRTRTRGTEKHDREEKKFSGHKDNIDSLLWPQHWQRPPEWLDLYILSVSDQKVWRNLGLVWVFRGLFLLQKVTDSEGGEFTCSFTVQPCVQSNRIHVHGLENWSFSVHILFYLGFTPLHFVFTLALASMFLILSVELMFELNRSSMKH